MGWLDGYVAIVTGGGNGIGRAVTRRYLHEGARGIVVVDRDMHPLADEASQHRGRLVTIAGDVRDYAVHEAAVAAAIERFGRLDVTVGNAGVFDFRKGLDSFTPQALTAAFEEILAINLRGYLFAAHASRDALIRNRGSMIFTVSVAGFHAGGGGVLYTASKHAVVGMIRQLAADLAPEVRVNGVGPGGTLTDLRGTAALGHEDRSLASRHAEMTRRMESSVPLRFAQQPEDHAGLYVLLASRENARATTGQVVMSDGGIGVRPL
jgi:NAD(P)-dependent dehydrogenase (short-subunit alcohol dehydrogenase family)